jgi:hypothetical protein
LTASQAVIFASVRVVFLDCPYLDCLFHDVTASPVNVTSFTNHSDYGSITYPVKRSGGGVLGDSDGPMVSDARGEQTFAGAE